MITNVVILIQVTQVNGGPMNNNDDSSTSASQVNEDDLEHMYIFF